MRLKMKARQFSCQSVSHNQTEGGVLFAFLLHSSRKARSVISLVRPCAGRSEFEHYATVKDNTAGLLSLLAFWKLSDSSLPVYLHHQLFRQLGSFRLNLAQVKHFQKRDYPQEHA